MIIDFLITILDWIITLFTLILPVWSVWPADLLSGLSYFFSSLATLNFIFPIDKLFTVILFLLNFEVLYFGAKLTTRLINFVRGSGELHI